MQEVLPTHAIVASQQQLAMHLVHASVADVATDLHWAVTEPHEPPPHPALTANAIPITNTRNPFTNEAPRVRAFISSSPFSLSMSLFSAARSVSDYEVDRLGKWVRDVSLAVTVR
jgi:hypothetical protein